jgi:hypothetical protein
MQHPARIVKQSRIRVGEARRLPRRDPTAISQSVPKARAQVLSQEDGFVTIQVVCSCGQEIQLRCAYAAPAAGTAPAGQVPSPAASVESTTPHPRETLSEQQGAAS